MKQESRGYSPGYLMINEFVIKKPIMGVQDRFYVSVSPNECAGLNTYFSEVLGACVHVTWDQVVIQADGDHVANGSGYPFFNVVGILDAL